MADDDPFVRDDARLVVARHLVRQADTAERLRGWSLLAFMFATASFVAVAGVAPPGWIAITAVTTVLGGYLSVEYSRARRHYRRTFATVMERLAFPAVAHNDLRRYFDDHRIDHRIPASRDPAVRLLERIPTPVLALVLLALAELVRTVV
jgi:hypothetical protein